MIKQCFTCAKCRRDEGLYYYCTKREEPVETDPHGSPAVTDGYESEACAGSVTDGAAQNASRVGGTPKTSATTVFEVDPHGVCPEWLNAHKPAYENPEWLKIWEDKFDSEAEKK